MRERERIVEKMMKALKDYTTFCEASSSDLVDELESEADEADEWRKIAQRRADKIETLKEDNVDRLVRLRDRFHLLEKEEYEFSINGASEYQAGKAESRSLAYRHAKILVQREIDEANAEVCHGAKNQKGHENE